MTAQAPYDVILEYLTERKPGIGRIDPDLDLIENRILDSLGFVNFLYFLEERTGQEIALEDVAPEDFRTINAITARFFDGAATAR